MWFNSKSQYNSLIDSINSINESQSTEAIQHLLKTKFNGRKLKGLSPDEKKHLFNMVDKMIVSKDEKEMKESVDEIQLDEISNDLAQKVYFKRGRNSEFADNKTKQAVSKAMKSGSDEDMKSAIEARKNSTIALKKLKRSGELLRNKKMDEERINEVLDTPDALKRAAAKANTLANMEKQKYLSHETKNPKKWERKARQHEKFKKMALKKDNCVEETIAQKSVGVTDSGEQSPKGKLTFAQFMNMTKGGDVSGTSAQNSVKGKSSTSSKKSNIKTMGIDDVPATAEKNKSSISATNPGSMVKEEQQLDEKAVSKQQQKFFGLVRAIQKGEAEGSPEAEKAAKEMSAKEVKDFAETKHKGLPKKVQKESEDTFDKAVDVAIKNIKSAVKSGTFPTYKDAYNDWEKQTTLGPTLKTKVRSAVMEDTETLSFSELCSNIFEKTQLPPMELAKKIMEEMNLTGEVIQTRHPGKFQIKIEEGVIDYNSVSTVANITPNSYELNKRSLASYARTTHSGKVSDLRVGGTYTVKGLDNALRMFEK